MNEQGLTLIKYNTGDHVLVNESNEVVMVFTHDNLFWQKNMSSLGRVFPLEKNFKKEHWIKELWYDIMDGIFPVFMVTFIVTVFVTTIVLLIHSL